MLRPGPLRSKPVRLVVVGLLVVAPALGYLGWRAYVRDDSLVARARRLGFDTEDYIDLVGLTEKCFELRQPLSDAEWERAKRYLSSDNDRFRNRAQALLRAQENTGRREEAVALARTMLDDREEHVAAGALVILYRMNVPDRKDLAAKYKQDSRPAVKEMAVALETIPYMPRRDQGLE